MASAWRSGARWTIAYGPPVTSRRGTQQPARQLQDPEVGTPLVAVRGEDGGERVLPLADLRIGDVRNVSSWRTFRSRHGQPHYSGRYWCATTGRHLVYESRLELARLLLADFDPTVVAIVAQPLCLTASVDGRLRRHVPDFFLLHRDETPRIVDVKPAERLARPAVAEALRWPAEVFERHGWPVEVWTGADPTLLANVRFLAGYRRDDLVDPEVLAAAEAAVLNGDTIGGVEHRLHDRWPSRMSRPAVLRLLWLGRLRAELTRELDTTTVLWRHA